MRRHNEKIRSRNYFHPRGRGGEKTLLISTFLSRRCERARERRKKITFERQLLDEIQTNFSPCQTLRAIHTIIVVRRRRRRPSLIKVTDIARANFSPAPFFLLIFPNPPTFVYSINKVGPELFHLRARLRTFGIQIRSTVSSASSSSSSPSSSPSSFFIIVYLITGISVSGTCRSRPEKG